MKKISTLCVMMLSCMTLFAQHGLQSSVEPGSKGALPQAPVIDATVPANFINALTMQRSYVSSTYFGGYSYECWLSFPVASGFGGEYWTLEYKSPNDNAWTAYTNGDDTPYHFTYDNATPSLHGTTQYRLVMHGGDMDGYVSNVVTAQHPSMVTAFSGWSDSQNMYVLVGVPEGENLDLSVTTYTDSHWSGGTTYSSGSDNSYFVYQWYRRNPYTAEMTPIQGADQRTYTPVPADAGYELVLVISGDGIHHSFTHTFVRGTVKIAIRTGIAYYGVDGFVLNSEYALPEEGKHLAFEQWENDDYTYSEFAVSERKPGQYVCRLPMKEWLYRTLGYSDKTYQVIVAYLMQWEEEQEPVEWIREHQLMPDRYCAPLVVKPAFDGHIVATTVDVIGRNIDNEWVVKRTVEITPDKLDGDTIGYPDYYFDDDVEPEFEEGLYTFGDGYIIKAHGTDALATTYLGGTMLWSETKPIFPGEEWNEEKGDNDIHTAIIEMVTAPRLAEEGTGVIEGCVVMAQESGINKARSADGTSDANVYTVYLQKKDGTIVAVTETDAAGNYRFENLPFDSYLVLVNIDGCIQENPTEVTLSAAQPAVENVNYTVEDGAITANDQTGLISDLRVSTAQHIYGMDGQRRMTLQRGLNIVGGKKVIVK